LSFVSDEQRKKVMAELNGNKKGVSSQSLEFDSDPTPSDNNGDTSNRMLADDMDEENEGPIGSLDANEREEAESEVGSEITKVGYTDNIYDFENDEEWWIFKSQGEAEAQALESEKDLLETEPEILEGVLNNIGKENFVFMSETDIRIISGEEADAQLDGVDLDELKERANDFGIDFEDPEDRLNEDDENYDEDLEKANEALENDLFEKVQEKLSDDVQERLEDDPLDYFAELGTDTNQAIESNLVSVDIEKVAQEVIDLDGLGSLLSGYDGEEVETKNLFMYRTN